VEVQIGTHCAFARRHDLEQKEIAMTEQKSTTQELARGAGRALVHLGAIVVGFILMIVGIALGVTLVMLPAGIAVGFAGLFVFLWGIFGRKKGL
jgi:uncharacterized membrane protein